MNYQFSLYEQLIQTAVKWYGTKKIIELELSLCHLKLKTKDDQKMIRVYFKGFASVHSKIFPKLLIFTRNKLHPNAPNS